MKNRYTSACVLFLSVVSACLLAHSSGSPSSFSTSAPTGNTGAPGDSLCTSCHFPPGSQTGTITIRGLDDPILPDTTYSLSIDIELLSGAAPGAGFQLVALDGNTPSSASIGTLSNLGTNVGTTSSGNRVYLSHSGGLNFFVGNTVSYTADWTAPASAPNQVSFYAVGILANLVGDQLGDAQVTTSIQDLALDTGNVAGAVPDGDQTPGTPLAVRLEPGGDLVLEWDESCVATDTDYAIYEGDIGSYYSHALLLCTTGGSTSSSIVPGPDRHYYLVVPTNGSIEGSYGTDSGGTERPAGTPDCLPQSVASPVCP